ncbi:sporulation integral membrane protein YlbJ [Heyndrickxia sporothermodurans]|uniref:Sporulation integral membrane protein YlbJ n=2 Tax=Heyndrickxia sporothermodurans TaxID=46224 RepID=A0AB37H943_9BACI|nr:sporulation integral membrane protein YlbJ [Heyndrickxia sporothermodurans]MBL5768915.1 sporulation integral membrane protein YlbJ [Heyndrickxia sporothermodurans]MBL5772671.1 sporulation integral membrane protein YlbJ [Heyndrickxia sporothermodurans]MBL5776175.1 sporulation integral membrane protein YlbJ [Heyndrickxia sporothermodurans]MBL5779704.1 sporulation integral membrane protein YlbJ [Heyndrickxia sporothermodurans]MBL5783087.1 sporulation integral membrane protein YlbJ [Heyndrickxi
MIQSKLKTIFLALGATLIAISMIILPVETFDASKRGLTIWWGTVFPSLFPFFVISELLIGFGVVKFIGVILEPLMRPLFRVPGVGGFAWAMGMASGNPAGAKITARLREEKQISKIEAERLVSFTNYSSPLFIFVAVSVGFFHNKGLGILFAIAHYLGNILVGLIMRFYGYSKKEKLEVKNNKFRVWEAIRALHRTRIEDKRPIGKLLGDAVVSSIHTLLMIGGFIILFSVINRLLFHLQITALLASVIKEFFAILHFPNQLTIPFISGLFEITIGSDLISRVKESTLLQQSILTSFILGFGGFSIQAQVASILAQTDIRFKPFFIARILHGLFAAIITLLIWDPIFGKQYESNEFPISLPVFLQNSHSFLDKLFQWGIEFGPIITICSLLLYIFIYSRRYVYKK